PLAEIALACGYSSQAHFSSRFKQAVDVTPRQYRCL
ncbi:MAG: AraC family transcriptional regulator, partial [Sneathiella sp.]|nr:AraC family transcriptional regulator [Sneathiella sp.]